MWALRRAYFPFKSQGFGLGTARACFFKLEVSCGCVESKAVVQPFSNSDSDGGQSLLRFYHQTRDFSSIFSQRHGLSSQAGKESSREEEDDLEEGFSEFETHACIDAVPNSTAEDKNEDGFISESELSVDHDDIEDPAQNDLELSEIETDPSGKTTSRLRTFSKLFKAITDAPGTSVYNALNKYVEEGNDLSRIEIGSALFHLRKRRFYGRALQLLEWLETNKRLEFVERDYASRVDLIAKVHGLEKAEGYIRRIPESFRGEIIYRTLLANWVAGNNVKKAEEVFNKMKDKGFPFSSFACMQLLLLYKRNDRNKIADVLLLMEKENVKLSLFGYKILIDIKGRSNDLTGMDQVVEAMKSEGIEPDIGMQAILARHYISGGLRGKAETILKEMEVGKLSEHRWTCRLLLPLYAKLGKADEVERIWKVCESNLQRDDCLAAIEAWGKLKRVEKAEAVFDRMSTTWKKLTSRHYNTLLRVYADHKMLNKGKDLVKQMAESGCQIGPFTWDAIVKLHVEGGEVEKADSILQKAQQQNRLSKPMFCSYMVIMDDYANRGDIHNTEKIFHRMRQVGYGARINQFFILIKAYINAKSPAYGIRDRMRADNIIPGKALAAKLEQVDPFRKTALSDLLD